MCYCAAIPTLPTQTRVVILQHPRERDMPIGTARMASLCLPQSELHVGVRWADHAPLRAALADPARPPILLYPGPGARDILTDPPVGPVTLVVVDGTWSQAKSVVRDNPILHALPRYAFSTPEPSHYRIRREPRAEYCSTIEALMHVLGVLEGNADDFRALLAPFHAMVDAQLAAQSARPARRVRVARVKKPIVERLPPALVERFEDLVLVAGEANAWPYDRDTCGKSTPRDPQADELVHWVALRPATGERFEQFAAPAGALSPSTPFHTRLDAALLVGERGALFEAFAKFLRPTDVLGAWGHYATNLYVTSGGTLGERIDLRAVAQRLANKKLGGIEPFAASISSASAAPIGAGRAGSRLAALAGIVEHVRGLASTGGTPPR